MVLPVALTRQFGGSTSVDLRGARLAAGAMVGIAAVRPAIPFEFVPPCPLRTITGIPCPMCGMTRGVTSLVNGDFAHALLMNPASYLALALVVLVFVQWRTRRVVVPVWAIIVVLALMWSWQLFKYSTGRPLRPRRHPTGRRRRTARRSESRTHLPTVGPRTGGTQVRWC